MQHDCIQKKKMFLTLNPTQGSCVCVFRHNICLNCIVHFSSFNLICNMTNSEKNLFWPFDPTLEVEGKCKDKTIACILLYVSFSFIFYATWLFSENNQTVLFFWSHSGVKGDWRPFFVAYMLSYISFPLMWYATWPYSERVNLIWVRGQSQGHSNPKIVRNTLQSQDTSTYLIWESYLNYIGNMLRIRLF